MTPSNGNIFRVTGPLWGESTGHRWIPLTKASDTRFHVFFDPLLHGKRLRNQSRRRRFEDAIALIMTSMYNVEESDQNSQSCNQIARYFTFVSFHKCLIHIYIHIYIKHIYIYISLNDYRFIFIVHAQPGCGLEFDYYDISTEYGKCK